MLRRSKAMLRRMESSRQFGHLRSEVRSRMSYQPLPLPPVNHHVPDPDGKGWWDDQLTPDQVRSRISGLAKVINHMEKEGAPKAWVAAERIVLSGLMKRYKAGMATA